MVLGTLYWQVSLYLRGYVTGFVRAAGIQSFGIRDIIYESVSCLERSYFTKSFTAS